MKKWSVCTVYTLTYIPCTTLFSHDIYFTNTSSNQSVIYGKPFQRRIKHTIQSIINDSIQGRLSRRMVSSCALEFRWHILWINIDLRYRGLPLTLAYRHNEYTGQLPYKHLCKQEITRPFRACRCIIWGASHPALNISLSIELRHQMYGRDITLQASTSQVARQYNSLFINNKKLYIYTYIYIWH